MIDSLIFLMKSPVSSDSLFFFVHLLFVINVQQLQGIVETGLHCGGIAVTYPELFGTTQKIR